MVNNENDFKKNFNNYTKVIMRDITEILFLKLFLFFKWQNGKFHRKYYLVEQEHMYINTQIFLTDTRCTKERQAGF